MLAKALRKRRNKDDKLLSKNISHPRSVTDTGLGLPFLLDDQSSNPTEHDYDAQSIASFSTTATTDDNLGTGRTVDNYLYRPAGDLIERAWHGIRSSRSKIAGNSALDPGRTQAGAFDGTEENSHYESEDKSSTASSFSTLATIDDNPGPGRTIDKYFYQKAGRKVELWAGRILITYSPPGAILNYMEQEASFGIGIEIPRTRPKSIGDVMSKWDEGNVVMDGWKALIKQTQSKSIAQAAVALAALLRIGVSYQHGQFMGLYLAISENEPIRRLEEMVRTLSSDNALRQPLLALSTLAEVSCSLCGPPIEPSVAFAQSMRFDLLAVLEEYQSGKCDLLDAVGDTCRLLSRTVRCSFIYSDSAPGDNTWDPAWFNPAWSEVFDATHHLLVYLVGSICTLCHRHSTALNDQLMESTAQKCHTLLLSTYAHWVDNVCAGFRYPLFKLYNHSSVEAPQWVRISAGISYLFLGTQQAQLLFPRCARAAKDVCTHFFYADGRDLPRRVRKIHSHGRAKETIASLFTASCIRTSTLLSSVEALTQDIRAGFARAENKPTITRPLDTISKEGRKEYLNRSLLQARRATVSENSLTEEFLIARTPLWLTYAKLGWRPVRRDFNADVWPKQWDAYKTRCKLRHAWGVYLRSELDWDWDTSKSLCKLFKV